MFKIDIIIYKDNYMTEYRNILSFDVGIKHLGLCLIKQDKQTKKFDIDKWINTAGTAAVPVFDYASNSGVKPAVTTIELMITNNATCTK